MKIIINNSSQQPIYEQIVAQIKEEITSGELAAGAMLPSVRGLAGDLRISALTVKKAYDLLEEAGFVATVHGKGSFVLEMNQNMLGEQIQKEIEGGLLQVIQKGRRAGIPDADLSELFHLLLEE